MGLCLSKKQPILDKLIIENSYDKSLFYIRGELYINNINFYNTIIYFYEDYLYLVSPKGKHNISYYKIHSWGYNKDRTCLKFHIYKENKKLIIYNLFMYGDKRDKISAISEKFKKIIYEHIEFINNF